jgi:hypothetical protein
MVVGTAPFYHWDAKQISGALENAKDDDIERMAELKTIVTDGGDSLEGKLRVTASSCLLPVHPKFAQQKHPHQLCLSAPWHVGKMSEIIFAIIVKRLCGGCGVALFLQMKPWCGRP